MEKTDHLQWIVESKEILSKEVSKIPFVANSDEKEIRK